jgi:hypothetical protein
MKFLLQYTDNMQRWVELSYLPCNRTQPKSQLGEIAALAELGVPLALVNSIIDAVKHQYVLHAFESNKHFAAERKSKKEVWTGEWYFQHLNI